MYCVHFLQYCFLPRTDMCSFSFVENASLILITFNSIIFKITSAFEMYLLNDKLSQVK